MKRLICCFIVLLALFLASCSKTIVFKQEDQKIHPLKTDARILRLHEDYLFADSDARELKQSVIENIKQVMSQQNRYEFEFIAAGEKVPKNNSNNESIFLIGDIWMYKGNTSGSEVEKVSRSQVGFGYTRSWDELERRSWEQDSLQTVISLYFIEVGNKTRILRSTITISNDKKTKIKTGGRTISDRQYSDLFKDKELQAGYQLVESSSSITSTKQALEELAKKAVTVHFDNL